MKVFLIFNGQTRGSYDLDFASSGTALVPLREYAEAAGASVIREEAADKAQVQYCGRTLMIPAAGGGPEDGRMWVELDLLVQLLGVKWKLVRDDRVLIVARTEPALAGKKVVVDAGNGGEDTGADGLWGLQEKTLNLAAARALCELLAAAGAKVELTRDGDTALPAAERVAAARLDEASALVSIHHNSSWSPDASGTEVYYYQDWAGGSLAAHILHQLIEELGMPNLGLKQAAFYELRHTPVPAVLVQVGFITSRRDAKLLQQHLAPYRTAAAIFRGIRQFFEEKLTEKPGHHS